MKNEIILYKPNELPEHIEVIIDEERETFWLSLNQIADLFERDKSVISRHLKNIFKDKELDRNSVVAFFATTASDGKTYNVEHFNLDAILSVGYRVNSIRGTQFRIWANRVLKDYLMKSPRTAAHPAQMSIGDSMWQLKTAAKGGALKKYTHKRICNQQQGE
jgi:hypothetical protein